MADVSGSLASLGGNVLANVIAGALLAGAGYALTKFLVPRLRGMLRRTPRLGGTVWRRVLDDPDQLHSTLEIQQSGTKITGIVRRDGGQRQRKYRYRGHLAGHQIVLSWEDIDSPDQMVGTMMLHLSANLMRLEGYTSYYRLSEGKVVANRVCYDRITT